MKISTIKVLGTEFTIICGNLSEIEDVYALDDAVDEFERVDGVYMLTLTTIVVEIDTMIDRSVNCDMSVRDVIASGLCSHIFGFDEDHERIVTGEDITLRPKYPPMKALCNEIIRLTQINHIKA